MRRKSKLGGVLEGVIFDFDGLILETETPEVRSWEAVFRHYGVEYPEWYWRFALGRGAEQVSRRPYDLLLELGIRATEAEVLELRSRRLDHLLAELEILPGVLDRLDEAAAMGLAVGIASSSRHEWVDGHLDRLGLSSRFRRVICADDVERAKPFPDLYQRCCDCLGACPAATVAFEDSVNGALAARAAGLFVVGVPTHLTPREELDADLIVSSLTEVTLSEIGAAVQSRRADVPRHDE